MTNRPFEFVNSSDQEILTKKSKQKFVVVMEGDLWSKDHGFESQQCILDGHFSHCIGCKNCNVCLRIRKNEKKVMEGKFIILFVKIPVVAK